MKITAIDASTGRVLMSQSGSMSEALFKKTVIASFPDVDQERIIMVVDGRISGRPEPRQRGGKAGKSVVWRGSFTDAGGYANMNREICLRLQQYGFTVKAEVLKTGVQVDPMTYGIIRALENVTLPDESRCPLVVGFTPMQVRAAGRRVIFYTMMESQSLHKEFVDRCNQSAKEIWVPGEFCRKLFESSGIVRPIHVLPLGVNEKIYRPNASAPDLRYEEMPSGRMVEELPQMFRFVSVFGWSYRKGPDVLCRSFLEEFDAKDGACLVIYSRYMGSSLDAHKEHIRKEIRGYYAACGKSDAPPIFYCGDAVPIADMPGCYSTANAFVLCSRGEGFGLPAVEAGACGVPVVSSMNTAMTDYLDDDVAYCVPGDGYAPANEKLCWISSYYRDQEFAVLGEEAVRGFRLAMKEVFSKTEEAAQKAQNFRERVLSMYTWDACAARIAERLKMG